MADWDFSCPDWEERLLAGRSLLPDLPLWHDEAERAVAILGKLRLHDVPGTPTMAEASADWFFDIARAVHGSRNPVTGRRLVPRVMCLVPKKNNKTTGGGLLMVTSLLMNRRPSASFAMFGPVQKTAEDAYDAAAGAIELDPGLKKLLRTIDHLKTIEHRRSGATLQVASYDPKIATGKKFAGWLLDELHVLGVMASASRVLQQMCGASAAIHESFGVIITTQSDGPPAGVFKQELDYARRVRAGEVADPQCLPLLYEFPERIQRDKSRPWEDPALWPIVNPNMGRSVNIEVLKGLRAAARDKGDAEYRVWASQHLNIEIGLALHNDRWPGADHWEAASDPAITLEHILKTSEVCTIGVDGGGLDDLLAVAVLGRHAITKRWQIWVRAFVDEGVLTLRKQIAPRLLDLQAEGDLVIVDIVTGRESEPHAGGAEGALNRDSRAASSPDVEGVAAIVQQVFDAGLLPEKNGVGLDPVGVSAIVDALSEIGLPEGCLASVPQGYRLTGSILGMARKLKDGGLVHGGQPLMAWAVGNAKQESRGNAVVITKETAGRAKIDPLLAAFNAFELMTRNPEAMNVITGSDVFEVV